MSAESAVTAAGAATWSWHAEDSVLAIRAEPGGPFSSLDGVWRLEAFLEQLDGLARSTLRGRFAAGMVGEPIDARVTLTDGRKGHFVGSFCDLGLARGLLMSPGAAAAVAPNANVEAVFQAIRRFSDLGVAGFEALARFRGGDGELVGPESRIATGTDTDWRAVAPAMLEQAAAALVDLRASGRDVFMQVNLSAAEIARPDLVEEMAEIIARSNLAPGALRIELTEQTALRDFEGALGALAAFRAAGAGLVLDDFGAGHSSFAWLCELPADGVKLDPRLVRLIDQPRAQRIVGGLVGLVRSLNMSVVAEGVEDFEGAETLKALGCDFVQGFAYDLPMRLGDIRSSFEPKG